MLPRVRVYLDGVECEGAPGRTAPRRARAATTPGRDPLRVPGSPPARTRSGTACSPTAESSTTYERRQYDLGGESGTFVFDAGHRELDAGERPCSARPAGSSGSGQSTCSSGSTTCCSCWRCCSGAQRLRDVVEVATAFTVAHRVTLVLAALGWVSVPAWIVEPLIALSIAFVALETCSRRRARHRLPVVFGFGLLHGLGFAGALSWAGGLDLGRWSPSTSASSSSRR